MKMIGKIGLLCVVLMAWANVAPAADVELWGEDFQGFTAAPATGSPIVPQDSSWALTGSGVGDHHANVADKTYDNGTGWGYGWSYFGDLPDGEKVLAVMGFQNSGADGITTATKTLPGLGATQTTLTASATICTFYDYPAHGRWFVAEFMISNAADDNIVHLLFNKLNGAAYINGERLDVPPYNYEQLGPPEDFDFVMDFDADTVDMYLDDTLLVTDVAMNADYSASDVQQVKASTNAYGGVGYQGIMYVDNLAITEIPEPMTMSLLALGGLALIRRRKEQSRSPY